MKSVTAGSRTIYYARAHHQVLAAWTDLRRRLSAPPHLITLDRNTDLMPAFRRNTCRRLDPNAIGLVKPSDIENGARAGSAALAVHTAAAAKLAIRELAHDEHIDAARRADIIADVFLLQSSTNGDAPPWADVHDFDVFDSATADASLEPSRLDPFISMIERNLSGKLENSTYILDIDLDYFHTRAGATPKNPAPFHRLVRNAALITIALEPRCVREPTLLDKQISARQLLERVLPEIAKA